MAAQSGKTQRKKCFVHVERITAWASTHNSGVGVLFLRLARVHVRSRGNANRCIPRRWSGVKQATSHAV
ncbi:protein of unknown function [Pararobbsia alpina]